MVWSPKRWQKIYRITNPALWGWFATMLGHPRTALRLTWAIMPCGGTAHIWQHVQSTETPASSHIWQRVRSKHDSNGRSGPPVSPHRWQHVRLTKNETVTSPITFLQKGFQKICKKTDVPPTVARCVMICVAPYQDKKLYYQDDQDAYQPACILS